MRIALVNKKFTLKGGGAERYAVDFANALIDNGYEVDCYGNVIEDINPAASKYFIPMIKKPGFLKILSFNHNYQKIISQKYKQYDIIYALTQVFPADLYFMGGGAHEHWMNIRFPNRLLNYLKYLISPTHIAQLWIECQIFKEKNCHTILANSELIKNHAKIYGNVSPERVFVVYNGIDSTRFNPEVNNQYRTITREELNIATNDIAISYLSHNWSRKGLITIFEALADIKNKTQSNYKVLIAGKGNIEEYRKKGLNLGLNKEDMIFLGSHSTPEKIYAASDISILPTMYDPCAGVTVEAMACGVPTITTQENGSHELITHEKNGFILDQHDNFHTLSEYLLKLENPKIREKFGRNAAEAVKNRTFKQVVAESIEVMTTITKNKKH